jgi:TnpA family transposase
MIKYATRFGPGTASIEAILRRFTCAASHPTYQAMLELGRAVRRSSWPGTCGTGLCSARSTTG